VSVAREFATGAGLLVRGVGLYARSGRLVLLGLIPAVVCAALFAAAFGTLLYFADELAGTVTPFADDWSSGARTALRLGVGFAIVGVAAVVGVLTFTAVTLLIGDPFYERISEYVEDRFGGVPDAVDRPFWVALRRNLADSVRLLATSLLIGVPLFFGGLVPVVGQVTMPVVAALVGGWLLVLELVGVPFARRGLRLADRRRALRGRRPLALGFGVAVFATFLIPMGAVLVMPAAVAGAALLTRRVLGAPA
jgi:CysZ protein